MKFVAFCHVCVCDGRSVGAVRFRAVLSCGLRGIDRSVGLRWCVGLDLWGEGGVEMLGQGG